ncbi:N-acetylglucosamine kinase [Paenibacillus hamazuiensis]|uniref:N-acetylglucosamine kinase n=1 Tax=Paenibacillus hamazuiensis TaxID=2936508 RepID=UPI00200D49B7|nr:BadF/BadG/BcrA/BcrD ATPase family protein [Paenibacillus hamazuiensis]
MKAQPEVVIGIDGGGTYTRLMVSDLDGKILSYVETGASSFKKDAGATRHVHEGITSALSEAACSPEAVKGVMAGIAGYDSEMDLEWVEELTEMAGLHCPRWHVNDAVIAHAGAFLAEPGIVVISGTGSILFAITEEGAHIRNYDLKHYAHSAARFLAYDAVYEMLAGNIAAADETFVHQTLTHWSVRGMDELRQMARYGFIEDRRDRDRQFGLMGPLVTGAAEQGSPLAQTVCDRAAHQISVGVELLGAYFESETVAVSFIGSVINSPYMKEEVSRRLLAGKLKTYRVVKPALSAVAGAVIMALKRLGKPVDTEIVGRIRQHYAALVDSNTV